MIKQTLTWTTLPHGSDGPKVSGTELRLSVFVAPRLWNDDANVTSMPLGDFADWLDWPAIIASASFQVEFAGGPTLPAVPENVDLRSDLWQALFKPTTTVTPFQFEDLSGTRIVSFPAGTVHGGIKGIYQRVAVDPGLGGGIDLPGRDVLAADPGIVDIARPVEPAPPWQPPKTDRGPVFVGDKEQPRDDREPPPEPEPEGCWGCLLAPFKFIASLFGSSGSAAASPPSSPTSAAASAPPPVAASSPAPAASAVPPAAAAAASAQSAAFTELHDYAQPHSTNSVPLPTASEVEDEFDFHQMVSTLGDYPRLVRNLGLVVDLVVTLDPTLPADTGTIRVIPTVAPSLASSHATPSTHYELATESFVARPRTGSDLSNGLLRLNDPTRFEVVQTDVMGGGLKLQNTATNVRGLETLQAWPANSPDDAGLPALQTAGISVIRPEITAELTWRIEHAYALNVALAAIDLSSVLPYAGTSAPPVASDELFADDLVRGYRIDVFDDKAAAWHSLCWRSGDYEFLEGTGGPISLQNQEDEGFVQLASTESLDGGGDRELRVHESLFTWDGWSLAAPRPGLTILPDHTAGAGSNPAVTQFKLETAFRPRLGSLPRLRFGWDYRIRARVVDLAGNSAFGPDEAAFQVTQAETTAAFAFGRFEPVAPPPLVLRELPIDGESLERLVVRSSIHDPAATIAAQSTERHVVPPKTSQLMSERHAFFDASPGMLKDQAAYDLASREAGSLTHSLNPLTGALELIPGTLEEEPSPGRVYWLQPNAQFEVAFLPDPFARGVLLTGLPGLVNPDDVLPDVNKIAFTGAWPNVEAFRLQMVGIDAGIAPALPAWSAADRVLTVQVPQGETVAVRYSSYFEQADLEQMGVWHWIREAAPTNLVDLEKQAVDGRNWLHLPFRELVLVHAVQEPLAIPVVTLLQILPAKQLGDTAVTLAGNTDIDAKSTGKVDLRAAWVDPFDDVAQPAFDPATDVVQHEMHVDEVTAYDSGNDHLAIADVTHAFNDTKYHRVTYSPTATTRYREYFPPAVLANPDGLIRPTPAEVGTPPANAARFELEIPNSARPDAVRPLYSVPAFSWIPSEAAGVTTRQRQGGGIRLYMERPWFSSGDGELLGLVLRPAKYGPLTEHWKTLRKYVSEWGMDPIWRAAETAPLVRTDFVNSVANDTGLTLEELPGLDVDVVGFQPQYDADRNLWFCDIVLNADRNYFPFVRMALVRYHPVSVPGAHLSRVVLSDFVQVLPDRRVEYDLNQVGTGSVPIRVSGPAYHDAQRKTLGSPIVFARVERRVYETGDELGWEVLSSTVLPPTKQDVVETVWEGEIGLPSPAPGPLRILVLEMETYAVDDEDRGDGANRLRELALEVGDRAGNDDDSDNTLRRLLRGADFRIVFADSLEVGP